LNGGAYYNEIEPFAAEWLRQLIKADLIAPGEVDERSIEQVEPADLAGFTQCHFFAGIGVWSYALRLAGWPDDRPVWTGSCPCPSFSAAGKGQGFDDARHLWPAWYRLIRECRPATLFGEQVDKAIGFGWLDLVQTDLESEAYSVGKRYLERAAQEHRTSGKGFTSWPTPNAMEGGQTSRGGNRKGEKLMGGIAKLATWPTCRANDAEKRGKVADDPRNGLVTAANLASWSTPKAEDAESAGMRHSRGVADTLTAQSSLATTWATPNSMDYLPSNNLESRKLKGGCTNLKDQAPLAASGETRNGSGFETESTGQLNPAHPRWLQGLPAEWDVCADMATQSRRQQRKPLSKRI
jgi:hypothetical protein